MGSLAEPRGAAAVARAFKGRAQLAKPALVDGEVGVVVAPRGWLLIVLGVTVAGGRIVAIGAVADPERLGQFELAIRRLTGLPPPSGNP